MHNEVPCPGWRKLEESELIPPDNNNDNNSDTESFHEEDSAFLEMHDKFAQEERARWAGYSVKTKSAATKGGNTNSVKNSKSKASKRSRCPTMDTIYPTAMESFLLVEEAKAKYLSNGNGIHDNNSNGDPDKEGQLRRNLQYFKEPLAAFARIEAVILEQKHRIRAILNLRKEEHQENMLHNDNMRSGSTTGVSPVASKKKKRARHNPHTHNILRTSQRRSTELIRAERDLERDRKPRLDLALIELSLSRLDTLESVMEAKSASLYGAFEDLLKQANWKIPNVKSFTNMNVHFRNACQKSAGDNTDNDSNTENTAASDNRLADCIRSGIDKHGKYPLVAKTFKLHKDYQIDGCAPRSGWKSKHAPSKSNGNTAGTEPTININMNNSSTQTMEENTLTYHGFSLPSYALNSETESDDEVANPLTGGDVWAAVRKRLAKKSNPFLRETIQPGDVELDISISVHPSIIHPDDKIHLQDTPPQTPTVAHQVHFDDADKEDNNAAQDKDPIPLTMAQLELNSEKQGLRQEESNSRQPEQNRAPRSDGQSNAPAAPPPRESAARKPTLDGREDAEMADKGTEALAGVFNTAVSVFNDKRMVESARLCTDAGDNAGSGQSVAGRTEPPPPSTENQTMAAAAVPVSGSQGNTTQ